MWPVASQTLTMNWPNPVFLMTGSLSSPLHVAPAHWVPSADWLSQTLARSKPSCGIENTSPRSMVIQGTVWSSRSIRDPSTHVLTSFNRYVSSNDAHTVRRHRSYSTKQERLSLLAYLNGEGESHTDTQGEWWGTRTGVEWESGQGLYGFWYEIGPHAPKSII
jgi:hypothetical protein